MNDQYIYDLACIFKSAVLTARDKGHFNENDQFSRFPKGCCGPACRLLATFLKEYGIETIYVWGDYRGQTHAWLVVNDNRVKTPTTRYIDLEDEYVQLVNHYGGDVTGRIEDTSYKVRDLTYGLIIDITADQFGGASVYVGERNPFYRRFSFREAHICDGVDNYYLRDLYRKVSSFLPE